MKTATVQEPGRLLLESPDLKVGDKVTYSIEHDPELSLDERRVALEKLFGEIEERRRTHPESFRTKEEIDASLRAERDSWD
ncbi:hypothetical protein BH11ARM2_BH11ARM2_27410 [soil metagenome]